MNTQIFVAVLAVGAAGLTAACSTVESRTQSHQAAFDAWPADVQQKVRARKVDIGFTPEMVRVALGDPDRVAARTTAQGASEVWVYFDHGPHFSFGLGVGAVRGTSAYGGDVAIGNDFRDEEVMSVEFEGGRVSAIETRK